MFDVHPQSLYLAAIVDAFRRRHRAISSKIMQLLVERVIENDRGEKLEKIEVTYRRRRPGKSPVIRLHVWSDRWAWVDAREAAKAGWRWEWTGEGRISRDDVGQAVVRAFESTIGEAGMDVSDIQRNLAAIWSPLLAKGPATLRPE